MADYPPDKIVDMILVLGECHNNYRATARRYAERFPGRRHPNHTTIRKLTQRARNGRLARQRRRHEYDENDARASTVLAAAHLDSQISSRQMKEKLVYHEERL